MPCDGFVSWSTEPAHSFVELNGAREQQEQEGNNTQGFSPSMGAHCSRGIWWVSPAASTGKCNRGEGASSRDPTGQWTVIKRPSACSAPFPQRHHGAPTPKRPRRGGAGSRDLSPRSGPHVAPAGSRSSRRGSRQSCVQSSPLSAASLRAPSVFQA